jgi:hypothetical protein
MCRIWQSIGANAQSSAYWVGWAVQDIPYVGIVAEIEGTELITSIKVLEMLPWDVVLVLYGCFQ